MPWFVWERTVKQWPIWVYDLHGFSNYKKVEVQVHFLLADTQLDDTAFGVVATKDVTHDEPKCWSFA